MRFHVALVLMNVVLLFCWNVSYGKEPSSHVHRLQTAFRSPFDAFLYVNRIPSKPETGESAEDLAGRILGRLANQEGRVQVKLPPGMDRNAYLGFKIALGEHDRLKVRSSCLICHHLPELANANSSPSTPSLRNRSYPINRLRDILVREPHQNLQLNAEEFNQIHSLLKLLTGVSDEKFRELIIQSAVLDTSGDTE